MLFPLLRSHSRVVNLSSSEAALKNIPGDDIREKLAADNLTEPELTELMDFFVQYDNWYDGLYLNHHISDLIFIIP